MSTPVLDSHPHHCFHSPRCNVHQHPDLHHCNADDCQVVVHPNVVRQARLKAADGTVSCPKCGSPTILKQGQKIAEVHAKLCLDETIHYPEMHKAGKINAAQYAAWKDTLNWHELRGYYKRVPDVHLTVTFSHDETALMDTDLDAFNDLLQRKLKERAENALLYQVPHRHETTKVTVTIPSN